MNRPKSLSTRQAIEATIERAETDGRWGGDDRQEPIVTRGRDQLSRPFVTWRLSNGRCCRAWIECTHGQAAARFLFSVRTDTIDGNAIGEPISAPVYHDMADLEALLTYDWATLEPVNAE
jgi:hypothetical protein